MLTRSISRLTVLASIMLAVCAASTSAATYCVDDAACVTAGGTTQADLQTALNTASATPEADRVQLGHGNFGRAGGFSYSSSSPIEIVGAGRQGDWTTTGTMLTNTTGNPSAQHVLVLSGSAQHIVRDLQIRLPLGSGTDNTGLSIADGTARNLFIFASARSLGSLTATVSMNNATLDGVRVESANIGVRVSGGADNRITNSDVSATDMATAFFPGASGTVTHSTISSPAMGISIGSGAHVAVDNSLVRHTESAAYVGASAIGFGIGPIADSSLIVTHSTLLGVDQKSTSGIAAYHLGTAVAMDVTIRDSVIHGFDRSVRYETVFDGTVNFTSTNSAYAPFADLGTGSLSETNRIDVAGVMASGRLATSSPLIDAGTDAGGVTTDLDGSPRVVAQRSCAPRADIGAFELQSTQRAPHGASSASSNDVRVTERVTFSDAGSCDADGDALTYAWNFGDGVVAAGASTQHAFDTPGAYAATLIVTDTSGRTDTSVVRVVVRAAPAPPTVDPPTPAVELPPFTGARIMGSTSTEQGGKLRFVVSCPAANAVGTCTGKLTLAAVPPKKGKRLPAFGSVSVSVPAGTSKTVSLTIPRAANKILQARRTLAATATLVTKDASGRSVTTKRAIKLLK